MDRATCVWQDLSGRYLVASLGNASLRHLDCAPDERFVPSETSVISVNENISICATSIVSPAAWEETVVATGHLILPMFVHRGHLVLGPGLGNGAVNTVDCVYARVTSSSGLANSYIDAVSAKKWDGPAWKPKEIYEKFKSQIDLASSMPAFMLGMQAWFDMTSGKLSIKYIWPLPGEHQLLHESGEPEGSRNAIRREKDTSVGPIEGIIDPYVGPVADVVYTPPARSEPSNLATAVARIGYLHKFLAWKPEFSGSGMSFDRQQSRSAAIGEAVERYCGNYVPPSLTIASEAELLEGRIPFISMLSFISPFSPKSLDLFAPYDEHARLRWVKAINVVSGEARLLPVEGVYLNASGKGHGRAHFPVQLAGIAAGKSRSAAQESALNELVERDATMRWWHAGVQARRIVGWEARFQYLTEGQDKSRFSIEMILLSMELGTYVVASILRDSVLNTMWIGFAARPNLEKSMAKAAAEAWQLHRLAVQILNPDSEIWVAIAKGDLRFPLLRFKEDRGYRSDFASLSSMHQLTLNLQYYLDPESVQEAELRLQNIVSGEVQAATMETLAGSMVNLERSGEHSIWVADVTTTEFRSNGWFTVRATAPSLVGNYPSAFIPERHPRLTEPLRNTEDILYPKPLPHA